MRAIALDIDTGDVELVRGSQVTVEQTTEYLISKPDVERSVENGVLTISSDCGKVFLLDCTTDFRIEVPAGVAVKVRTSRSRAAEPVAPSGPERLGSRA